MADGLHDALSRPGVRPLLLVFVLLYVPLLHTHGYRLAWSFARATDLPSFHAATRAAFVEGRSPYHVEVITEAQERLDQQVYPFLYPPPALLALAPLGLVDYPVAKVSLLALNHLLILVLGALLLFRLVGLRAGSVASIAATAYILLFNPLRITLDHGQINLLVLAGICLAWLAMREGRHPALAAAGLALAIVLKTYPALLLLLPLVRRDWRTSAWTVGMLAAWAGLSLALLPAGTWHDWLTVVAPTAGYGRQPWMLLMSPAIAYNQSINGFAARLFLDDVGPAVLTANPVAARVVPLVASSAVVAASAAALWRSRAGGPTDAGAADHSAAVDDGDARRTTLDRQWSLLLVAMVLVAPLTWEHHLVLVLPAALVALRLAAAPRTHPALLGLVIATLGLLAWEIPYWRAELSAPPWSLLVSIKFYPALALWLVLLTTLWRPGPAATGREDRGR